MSSPEGTPEHPRTRRFRRFATRAFRPLSIVGPVALVVERRADPAAASDEGSTLLRDTAIIAVVLLAVLLTLVRSGICAGRGIGDRLFTRREAWTVLLLAFLLAWWCMGVAHAARTARSYRRRSRSSTGCSACW